MSASEIVNKVWNYAHVLRDDGVGYGDYVEQITYLIFLKMADEREKAGQQVQVPNKYAWAKLVKLDGDDLELQYRHTLENLGIEGGMLGTIFRKAQNKIDAGRSFSASCLSRHLHIHVHRPWPAPSGQPAAVQICSRQICQDPAKLERLIKMIDK
ncbi:MAG: type I restriction-modification system subunit M N-terminal domain-containing protein, partial [Gammaproteobacteria bacterium]